MRSCPIPSPLCHTPPVPFRVSSQMHAVHASQHLYINIARSLSPYHTHSIYLDLQKLDDVLVYCMYSSSSVVLYAVSYSFFLLVSLFHPLISASFLVSPSLLFICLYRFGPPCVHLCKCTCLEPSHSHRPLYGLVRLEPYYISATRPECCLSCSLLPVMIPELRQHVRDAARPLAAKYGLSVLPEFADIAAIALLFFTALQVSLSPAISRTVFPVSYGKADKRTRRNWYFRASPRPAVLTCPQGHACRFTHSRLRCRRACFTVSPDQQSGRGPRVRGPSRC